MPCLPLRQTVCQVLFAWDSPHFYSSRLGHLLQPQIPQFHVSSLTETSSRRYRFGSVGISPNLHLGGHAQVRHNRLHSKSLCCAGKDCVYTASAVLSVRVACVLDQCFTTVPLIIIIPPLVNFLSGPRTPDLPLSTSGFCPIYPKPSNNAVFVAALVLQTFLCPR